MVVSNRADRRAFLQPSRDDPTGKWVRRYHGSCSSPAYLPSALGRDVVLAVRCRRCPGCFRARRYLWALRAQLETLGAQKTILFTGTFAAQPHDRQVAADEVTRYLKRLRKGLDAQVRYLVCFERHKSGAWHVHMLLHTNDARDLTTRRTRRPWTAGFSDAKVADLKAAGYVTKYVTKDLVDESTDRVPRIRASRDPRYGDAVMVHEEAIVQQLQQRPEIPTTDLWATNIRMLHQYLVDEDKGNSKIWRQIMAGQRDPKMIQIQDGRRVDPTTGEILLPTRMRS